MLLWYLIKLQTVENISQTSLPGLYFILTPVPEQHASISADLCMFCGGKRALSVAVLAHTKVIFYMLNTDIQILMIERNACSRSLLCLLGGDTLSKRRFEQNVKVVVPL